MAPREKTKHNTWEHGDPDDAVYAVDEDGLDDVDDDHEHSKDGKIYKQPYPNVSLHKTSRTP